MTYLTANDLNIICLFSHHIVSIKDIKYSAEFNCHSEFSLHVVLGDNINTNNLIKETIMVQNKHDQSVLFQGIINTLEKATYNDVTTVKILCTSYSSLLDVTPKSRTFQDKNDSYKDILSFIYENYNGRVIIPNDKNISPPILQYDETDWAFTLRMAALLHTIAIVDDYADTPSVSIGFVDGSTCDFLSTQLQFAHRPLKDLRLKENPDEKHFKHYYLSATSGSIYQLGDYCIHENQTYRICKIEMQLKQELLQFHYTLGTTFIPLKYEKHNLSKHGFLLSGTVIDVLDETLKIHFNIDEQQSKEKAMWFHYRPNTNSMFYSIPEIGAIVMAKYNYSTFSVTHCIHDSFANFPKENQRYFNLTRGQTLAMLPEQLFFKDNSNDLILKDSEGLSLNSQQLITIQADGQISFSSNKINSSSLEQIKLSINDSIDGIDMASSEINLYATDFLLSSDGTNDKEYPKRDRSSSTSISTDFAGVVASSSISRISVE